MEGPRGCLNKNPGQEADSEGMHTAEAQGRDTCCGTYLLVEAQAQGEGPTVLLVPMLGTQQVLVEVRQRQAGPEVGA